MKLKKKTLVKRDLEHVENLIGCSIPGSIMISLQKLFQEEFPKKRKKERKKKEKKKKKELICKKCQAIILRKYIPGEVVFYLLLTPYSIIQNYIL